MKHILLLLGMMSLLIVSSQVAHVQGQAPTTIPQTTTIHMYAFDPNEFPRSIADPDFPCAAIDDNKILLGCTAFPNVPGYEYPYSSSVIEVDIDRDYLPDVVPQEMNPAEFAFPALVAQSVAARSWILHKTIFPDGNPILNDESNQVFIPYKFEEAGGVTNHTIDPDNPCSAENIPTLTIYQIELCTAVKTPWYVTTDSSSDPTFTQFERDFRHGDPTINGTAFFDPISSSTADCSASSGVNGTGMTQRGASRWAFGNHCSTNNPQDPWSVKWQQPQLILQHYYPSTLIRSTKTQVALQPLQRWNPLSIDWGNGQIKPPQMNPTTNYPIQVRLRNTGIGPWACDPNEAYYVVYRWATPQSTNPVRGSNVCGQDSGPNRDLVASITINNVPSNHCGYAKLVLDIEYVNQGISSYFSDSAPYSAYPELIDIFHSGCSGAGHQPGAIDIALVIDTTSSMEYALGGLAEAIEQIIGRLGAYDIDYRIGIVAYQDVPDPSDPNTANDIPAEVLLDFTSDTASVNTTLQTVRIGFGGEGQTNIPETTFAGIDKAITDLAWRQESHKVIIVIGDAPPKDPDPATGDTVASLITKLQGFQINPNSQGTSNSGIQLSAVLHDQHQAAMEHIAKTTGGTIQYAGAYNQTGNALLGSLRSILNLSISIDAGGPYFTTNNHVVFTVGSPESLSDNILFYDWDVDNDGGIDITTLDGTLDYTYLTPYSGKIRVHAITSDGIRAEATAEVNPQAVLPFIIK